MVETCVATTARRLGEHGFAVASTPVTLEGGRVDHSLLKAKGGDLAYQAGQKIPFQVTP